MGNKNVYFFSFEEMSIQFLKRPQEITRISCSLGEIQQRYRRGVTKICKKG
jgi:hypothetical protein